MTRRNKSRRNKILWPDGKHKHWETLDKEVRSDILHMLKRGVSTDGILSEYTGVTVGTLAAVKANLNR